MILHGSISSSLKNTNRLSSFQCFKELRVFRQIYLFKRRPLKPSGRERKIGGYRSVLSVLRKSSSVHLVFFNELMETYKVRYGDRFCEPRCLFPDTTSALLPARVLSHNSREEVQVSLLQQILFFSHKIQPSSVPCMTANNCTMDKSLRDNTLNIAKLYKISHVENHVITTKTKDHKRHSSVLARQCRLLTYMLTSARAKLPRA